MSGDPTALYQAAVLELARNPDNEGPLEGETHYAKKTNPLCGDRVTVHLQIEDGRVQRVTFEARGCAIAKASASLMTQVVRGLEPEAAQALGAALRAALEGAQVELGALEPLRAVSSFPARTKCATLPWDTLDAALE